MSHPNLDFFEKIFKQYRIDLEYSLYLHIDNLVLIQHYIIDYNEFRIYSFTAWSFQLNDYLWNELSLLRDYRPLKI